MFKRPFVTRTLTSHWGQLSSVYKKTYPSVHVIR